MIIYNKKSSEFINHTVERQIDSVLVEKVQKKMSQSVSPSELRSWTNSLPQMAKILRDADLKEDTYMLYRMFRHLKCGFSFYSSV